MNNDHTRRALTDWLAETFPDTSLNILATIADSGVSVVNRLVRQELREIASDINPPAARFDLYQRADRLLPRRHLDA